MYKSHTGRHHGVLSVSTTPPRRLNLPERTVRYLAQTGRLPAFKLDGKSWGFWPEDVDAFKRMVEADNAEVM